MQDYHSILLQRLNYLSSHLSDLEDLRLKVKEAERACAVPALQAPPASQSAPRSPHLLGLHVPCGRRAAALTSNRVGRALKSTDP